MNKISQFFVKKFYLEVVLTRRNTYPRDCSDKRRDPIQFFPSFKSRTARPAPRLIVRQAPRIVPRVFSRSSLEPTRREKVLQHLQKSRVARRRVKGVVVFILHLKTPSNNRRLMCLFTCFHKKFPELFNLMNPSRHFT